MLKDSHLSSGVYTSSPSSFQYPSRNHRCLLRQQLSNRDKARLQNTYRQISQALLERRKQKIDLLESYDSAIEHRAEAELELSRIEAVQTKKIADKRRNREAQLLLLLRKREKLLKVLREATKEYKKKHKGATQQPSFGKSQEYISLVRRRVQLESDIGKLQEEQRRLIRQNGVQSLADLQLYIVKLKDKHESLQDQYRIKVIEPKASKPQIRDLNCSQIKALIFNWSLQNQKDQIYSLLKRVKYPQQSFGQIQSFILEQQSQKEALYQDLLKLRNKLEQMQQQNRNIQLLLQEQYL